MSTPTTIELTDDEVIDVRASIVEAMLSSTRTLEDHLGDALGGDNVALVDARSWIGILARLAAVVDRLDPRFVGGPRRDAALGVALDCLADGATIEQLTAARAAADELGAAEASAQLAHLIDVREFDIARDDPPRPGETLDQWRHRRAAESQTGEH